LLADQNYPSKGLKRLYLRTMKVQEKEATRDHIISAALSSIAEAGFDGVSTRAIAEKANVSQGLLTYHFKSKESLWRAAAERLFVMHKTAMANALNELDSDDPIMIRRCVIRQLVHFGAEHPEFLRFMLELSKEKNEDMSWVSDDYIQPIYKQFSELMSDLPPNQVAHLFYIIAGAVAVIFYSADECERVTGLNARSQEAIDEHADIITKLIVPDLTT